VQLLALLLFNAAVVVVVVAGAICEYLLQGQFVKRKVRTKKANNMNCLPSITVFEKN